MLRRGIRGPTPCSSTARTRLDRGSHNRNRVSLDGWTFQARGRICGRVSPTQSRRLIQATATIPIVFAVAKAPVGGGLVTNLGRPSGNVTGLSVQEVDTAGERLELLREVVPRLCRMAILVDVGYPPAVPRRAYQKIFRATHTIPATSLAIITMPNMMAAMPIT